MAASKRRDVELTAPTTEVLHARALNAVHSYIAARLDYDHRVATPAFTRIANLIEKELSELGAGVRDQPQAEPLPR